MKAKSLIVVVLVAAVGAGGYWLGVRSKGASSPSSGAGQAARGPTAPLPAEGFRVTGETVTQTLSSVGTLVPRESVVLVSELPRRLVKINFEEGQLVAKDELLFKLDDSDLRADLQALEVRRKLASDTAQRQRDLLAKQTTSQAEFDRAQADLDEIAAEIVRKQVDLAKTEIRAPFAGRIGFRNVSEGAYVTANTQLANLQDTGELKVDFALPERYADEIAPGTNFTFTISASADVYPGHVIATEPQIDPATRSLHVRGIAANKDGRLSAGMFAEVAIAINPTNDGIMIPSRAIVPSATGHSVFVAKEGVATEHAVKIGIRTAERVQILSGLNVGDIVVTTNLLRIRDRSPVDVNRLVTE